MVLGIQSAYCLCFTNTQSSYNLAHHLYSVRDLCYVIAITKADDCCHRPEVTVGVYLLWFLGALQIGFRKPRTVTVASRIYPDLRLHKMCVPR